jgi:hypothetical protein
MPIGTSFMVGAELSSKAASVKDNEHESVTLDWR